jgi:predicted MFS family arabinose efflux permease
MSNRISTVGVGTEGTRDLAPFWVPLGLSIGPLVALGLARFAYALLLPAMRTGLDWSYVQAGAMNTANAAGYLLGALAAAPLAARFGKRRLFCVGVFGTAIALLGCGTVTNFSALLLLRVGAGALGALSFVLGASLVAEAGSGSSPDRQAIFISIYFAGAGLGISLSSLIVPIALSAGASGWQWSWIGFGATSILLGFIAIPAVRYQCPSHSMEQTRRGTLQHTSLTPLLVAYTLFGAGYIAYMTFIIAFLREENFNSTIISAFWVVLGMASVAAGFFWGRAFASMSGGRPMALVLAMNVCGAAGPLVTGTTMGVFLSAVLFGASLMAVPSSATAFIRKSRSSKDWIATIGRFTVMFGLGQCVGPLLAGHLSDSPSGIRLGLLVSTIVLAVAALVALLQPEKSIMTVAPD